MDDLLFELAKRQAVTGMGGGGIGTLGEKAVHAVLKHYLAPYAGSHEQRIGRYVADIVGEDGIVEIQTRGLYRLRTKLACFLEVAPVTVVHPVVRTLQIIYCDPVSGRPLTRRKSPKRENFYTAFHELYGIKQQLLHPGLRLCLLMLDAEEYRTPTGKKRRGRPAYHKHCLPTTLVDRLDIAAPADYRRLIPAHLPERFTSLEFAACADVYLETAQAALNVLRHVGAVRPLDAKAGRYRLHEIAPVSPSAAPQSPG